MYWRIEKYDIINNYYYRILWYTELDCALIKLISESMSLSVGYIFAGCIGIYIHTQYIYWSYPKSALMHISTNVAPKSHTSNLSLSLSFFLSLNLLISYTSTYQCTLNKICTVSKYSLIYLIIIFQCCRDDTNCISLSIDDNLHYEEIVFK